jgi:hypothetical protein
MSAPLARPGVAADAIDARVLGAPNVRVRLCREPKKYRERKRGPAIPASSAILSSALKRSSTLAPRCNGPRCPRPYVDMRSFSVLIKLVYPKRPPP